MRTRISPKHLEALVKVGKTKKWLPLHEALRKVGRGGAAWALPMLAILTGGALLGGLLGGGKQES